MQLGSFVPQYDMPYDYEDECKEPVAAKIDRHGEKMRTKHALPQITSTVI